MEIDDDATQHPEDSQIWLGMGVAPRTGDAVSRIEDNRVEWSNDKGISCERQKNGTSGGAAALRFPELAFSADSLGLNRELHMTPINMLLPSKDGFEKDPLGYGALAWHKWAMTQTVAGYTVDLEAGPTSEDLKSPVLWLSHAHAMAEAARVLIQGNPNLESIPRNIRGVSHCQYHAVALMLVGYSLEICLKAMLIIKKGVSVYQAEEKEYHHHSLEKLAGFIAGLSPKDKAILKALSHFVRWAGRYPDPGFGKENHVEEIFSLSEHFQISAKDLFSLSARIMGHTHEVLAEKP